MHLASIGAVLLAFSSAAAAEDLGDLPRTLAEEQVAPPVGPGRQDKTEPAKKYTEREQQVEVIAGAPHEEYPVGPYHQPEWTQHRRFPSTRVYVQQPPGGVEFEQWFEIRNPKKHGKDNEVRIREELEFGLGHRLQLDLYLIETWKGNDNQVNNTIEWRAISAEIRYALADWGEIFGNPTLYFEYLVFNDDENTIEPKLLLGGEIASGWHWGLNLVYERELGLHRDRTEEYKLSAGISYTLVDTYLSAGIAMETAYEAEFSKGSPTGRSRELHVGPSIQFRPIPKAHFDLEPLFGLTGQSKRMKMFIVFGWDF